MGTMIASSQATRSEIISLQEVGKDNGTGANISADEFRNLLESGKLEDLGYDSDADFEALWDYFNISTADRSYGSSNDMDNITIKDVNAAADTPRENDPDVDGDLDLEGIEVSGGKIDSSKDSGYANVEDKNTYEEGDIQIVNFGASSNGLSNFDSRKNNYIDKMEDLGFDLIIQEGNNDKVILSFVREITSDNIDDASEFPIPRFGNDGMWSAARLDGDEYQLNSGVDHTDAVTNEGRRDRENGKDVYNIDGVDGPTLITNRDGDQIQYTAITFDDPVKDVEGAAFTMGGKHIGDGDGMAFFFGKPGDLSISDYTNNDKSGQEFVSGSI